ncbi:MAG TPA: glycosyltransferase [Terriglobales bacterium]
MEIAPVTTAVSNLKSGAPSHAGDRSRPEASRCVRAERRRVFFLVDSLQLGGTETQAVELALRLSSTTYDVTLGCLKKEGPLLERLNKTCIRVEEFYPRGGLDSFGGLYQLLRLRNYLRKGKFDVVHTHDLWSNLVGIPAAKLADVPVTVSSQRDLSHDTWYKSVPGRLLREAQRRSTVVLTNANAIREGLIRQEGFVPARVKVIHNGIDTERFTNAVPDRVRLFYGLSDCRFVVLVGNMHSDVKGHPTLIAAARRVLNVFPNVRFVLVGDGHRRKAFEQMVADAKLGANFLFFGSRSDVPDILASCDIGILPSDSEGLPNALLEYMAAGLPTIATRVGGNMEVIADRTTGLLIPPQNPAALAESLIRLLNDSSLARRLGTNGQRFVRERFSFESLTRAVDDLYSHLLQVKGIA